MSKRQVTLDTLFAPAAKRVRPAAEAAPARAEFTRAAFLAQLDALGTAKGGTTSTKDLLLLEGQTLDTSWLSLLQDEVKKDYFLKLKQFLAKEGLLGVKPNPKCLVLPPARDIYAWSRYTPLPSVRVVIIGQDPYHDLGQAHGLCFSVKAGVKIPPSLRNIYKEIGNSYPSFVPPTHGNLSSWANSGVLLLNTALTVKAHEAGSHSKEGWEVFTQKLVDLVDMYGGSGEVGKRGKGVVFMAWGAHAAKRVAKLDGTKHLILKSAHPSPLSAHRGFLGNGHFRAANDWIENRYGKDAMIDWTRLDVGGSPPAKGPAVAVEPTSSLASDDVQ